MFSNFFPLKFGHNPFLYFVFSLQYYKTKKYKIFYLLKIFIQDITYILNIMSYYNQSYTSYTEYIYNYSKHMIKKYPMYILLALLLCCSYQLVPNRQSPIITNIIDMHISANQLFYVAYNSSHAGIYDAHTAQLAKILFPQSGVVSVSLSPDSRTIALTQYNGYITLYTITIQSSNVQLTQIKKLFNKQMNNQSNVLDTCFTGDSAFLVILYNDGMILGWTLEGLLAQGAYQGDGRKLACSPSSPIQFVIGTNAGSNTSELLLFSIDQQTLWINKKNITVNINQFSALNYITYNQAGSQIYVVGNSDKIIVFTEPNYQERVFYQGVGIIYKFLINKNGRSFAFVNTTFVVLVQNANMLGQTNEFATIYQTFALAQQGTRFIYTDQKNNAQLLDKCQQGQFYNQNTVLCQSCPQQCILCAGNSSCFQCASKYYYSEFKCLKCIDRCQSCVDSIKCLQCSHPFLYIQGKCACNNGFYIQEDNCVHGMDFWVFAIITGGASLVLFCFAFVNIMIMRKKQAKKYLLADQE